LYMYVCVWVEKLEEIREERGEGGNDVI
jgi:hypothetical protein